MFYKKPLSWNVTLVSLIIRRRFPPTWLFLFHCMLSSTEWHSSTRVAHASERYHYGPFYVKYTIFIITIKSERIVVFSVKTMMSLYSVFTLQMCPSILNFLRIIFCIRFSSDRIRSFYCFFVHMQLSCKTIRSDFISNLNRLYKCLSMSITIWIFIGLRFAVETSSGELISLTSWHFTKRDVGL